MCASYIACLLAWLWFIIYFFLVYIAYERAPSCLSYSGLARQPAVEMEKRGRRDRVENRRPALTHSDPEPKNVQEQYEKKEEKIASQEGIHNPDLTK